MALVMLVSRQTYAQVDFATIDTTKWEIDTIMKSLTITPKFDFVNDTTIYFYQTTKKKREKIVTLNYVHKTKYIFETFSGTSRFPDSNLSLQLNFYNRQLDSLAFLDIVDTIISTDSGKNYCIKIKNFGIKDTTMSTAFQDCCLNYYRGYFRIAFQGSNESFPNSCFAGVVMVQHNDPPYNQYDMKWAAEIKK
jgi:hypothetical protein